MLARVTTKATLSPLCASLMAEVWAAFGMGACMIGAQWLGIEELTVSFLPRLNPLSGTKSLLLYPTVPDLIFKFISLGSK